MADRNPLIQRTIDDDMADIQKFAAVELDETVRQYISQYVHDGCPLEYYYGQYILSYQLFTVAHVGGNEFADTIKCFLQYICWKIVTVYKPVEDAKKLLETGW